MHAFIHYHDRRLKQANDRGADDSCQIVVLPSPRSFSPVSSVLHFPQGIKATEDFPEAGVGVAGQFVVALAARSVVVFVVHGVQVKVGTGPGKAQGVGLVGKGRRILGKAHSVESHGLQVVVLGLEGPVSDGCGSNNVICRVVVIEDRIVPDPVGNHVQKGFHGVGYRVQGSHPNGELAGLSSLPAFHMKDYVVRPVPVFFDDPLATACLYVGLETVDLVQEGFLPVLDPLLGHVPGPAVPELVPGLPGDFDRVLFLGGRLQLGHFLDHSRLVLEVLLGLFEFPLLPGDRIFRVRGILEQSRAVAFL
mmetsp:Transcript_4213/g.12080  ORF Transcript_4213/g.12080 Transcript_4213/m.12080 type:complete len:307 (-) Transcript_4213:734-1654(-)